MQDFSEITVPQTRPASEWVRGRALQKMSPRPRHAALQGWVTSWLREWAAKRGFVGSELDIKIGRPHEALRPLVPDVCFVSFDRWSRELFRTDVVPRVAPDIVVEILSPGDRRIDLEDKLDVYLQAGTTLAIVVDPRERSVETFRGADLSSALTAIHHGSDVIACEPFEALALPLTELFSAIDY